ncbi:efflux RND transporter permease subunit [Altererythrobacter sp. GH1-8]|uniref:efflux RND transporter permease subunit n=1 Tax=Altererythrobacter sp. GH1-8 TaxID=3349333 RepID=UPI00374CDB40
MTGSDDPANEPSELPRDRYGRELSDRARDRTGLIAFMARNGVSANLLMIFILVAGLVSFSRIPQEVFPESSLDTIAVSVAYPGATPAEIEQSIVQRIEEAVDAIDGVKKVTATASEGAGSVSIELESDADNARVLDEVKSEIGRIDTFPDDAEEPNIRELTLRQTAMRIALYGDVPERALKEAAYSLEDAIAALPAVSFVETSAVRDYQILIDVPQERLRGLGLSLNEISRTISAGSLDSPAGSIDTPTDEVRLRTVGQNYDQQDFENIVVLSTREGGILRLGDIAEVTDGFEDADLITRFNGQPVAFVDIYRTSDERVLDVVDAVKTMLESYDRLPQGVSYAIWEDRSEVLQDRLGLLLKNAAFGLFLVLVALTLFLDIRLAAWTAVGIGVTFSGAFFLLELAGSTINLFSLFGFILALGLVVDDAVVVGENISSERERGRSGLGAAIAGTQRVKIPVIFAVLTTIIAFLPLTAVEGGIGRVFKDVPIVVLAILSLSLIEAMLILPYHLSHLPAHGAHAKNRITRFFERVQTAVSERMNAFVEGPLDRAVRYCVTAPYVAVSAAIAILILFVAMIPGGIIKASFFPEIEADQVVAALEMPSGTTIDQTSRVTARIEEAAARALARFDTDNDPDASFVEAQFTVIGLRETQSGPGTSQRSLKPTLATVEIALVPSGDRTVSAQEIEQAWREEIGEMPEVQSLTISSTLVNFGEPVNVKISHPDEDTLDTIRERMMVELSKIQGVFDIESDQDIGMQEIALKLKPSARILGVTLQDVASQVRAGFFGAESLRVQRGREDVRVYVRLPEEERNSISDIEKFRILTPGGFTSVGAVADIEFTTAPSQIRREDGRRVVTITADLDEDVISAQEINRVLEDDILAGISADYPELNYSFGGLREAQADSFGPLGSAFGLALLAIYALLAVPFRSYTQPLVIMAAIPFGLIGALLGHLLLGIPVVILSAFGIVALSGVIINGSLVLIDFFNENLSEGMSPEEAIIDASKSRFRPIFLTAITTFLGVAPITFETSVQAQFLIPMSVSLGFGVLVGTILLVLVIPALAILHHRAKERMMALFGQNSAEDAPSEQLA